MKNSSSARSVLALALGIAVSSITSTIAAASGPGGGSGSGGSGSGGSGGGGGTTASSTIAFSNFGPSAPAASGGGWAVVGMQATGYFDYVAEQFTPTVSGTVSGIRIPINQYDTGGNGQFTFRIFADDPNTPNTLGSLLGSFQGRSAASTSTALSTISVSGGPRLVAGQQYWAEVVPSSQSREAWTVNPMGSMGLQYYVDPYSSNYLNQAQGAFEISVVP